MSYYIEMGLMSITKISILKFKIVYVKIQPQN